MRAAALGMSLTVLAAAAGCGSHCHDICDACAQPAGRTQPQSWPDACDELDDLSSAADCDDAWNAYVDCMADRCDPTGCSTAPYKACITSYCTAHPEDDRCDLIF